MYLYNRSIRLLICVCMSFMLMFSMNGKIHSSVINITVSEFSFTPSSVHLIVGDTVIWTLQGSRPYTTTCDGVVSGTSLPSGAASWNSPLNVNNPVYSYAVTAPGSYEYVCSFYYLSKNMAGTIVAESVLPVELTDFVATTIKNEVILDWVTGREINNDCFEVQRINLKEYKDLNRNDLPFKTVGTIRGYGNSNETHNYKFIDKNLKTGIYLYRLKQIDYNSNYIMHLLHDEIVIGVPDKFSLMQNYPNPFNPETHIKFELPQDGFATISLIDISGKLVSTILNTSVKAGYQTVNINGAGLSSGVYYYRIDFRSANSFETATKKMMLIK